MKYTKVFIDAIGYELGPSVVTSAELEQRILPMLDALHIPPGQLEALTGIRERRWWNPGFALSEGAARAARKALEQAGLTAADDERKILRADGFLIVDGLVIYQMKDFAVKVV